MAAVFEQATNGLTMGALYAVFAVGMVLIFGVMGVLNFAHGALFMLGAYLCQLMFTRVLDSYGLAILASMGAVAIVGLGLELFVFRKLRLHLPMQIVASLGLIMILQNGIVAVFGASALSLRVTAMQGSWTLAGFGLTRQHLLVLAVVAVSVAGLQLFLTRTKLGTAIRATAQNEEAAIAVGIEPDRMFLLVFALGSALAALGGALLGPMFLIFPQMGDLPMLKALTAIVLGAVGSVGGAILGGLAIGLIEAESTLVLPTDFRDAVVFSVLIAVLLLRPRGLFGLRLRGEA